MYLSTSVPHNPLGPRISWHPSHIGIWDPLISSAIFGGDAGPYVWEPPPMIHHKVNTYNIYWPGFLSLGVCDLWF